MTEFVTYQGALVARLIGTRDLQGYSIAPQPTTNSRLIIEYRTEKNVIRRGLELSLGTIQALAWRN
jgi:hypothetical protein